MFEDAPSVQKHGVYGYQKIRFDTAETLWAGASGKLNLL